MRKAARRIIPERCASAHDFDCAAPYDQGLRPGSCGPARALCPSGHGTLERSMSQPPHVAYFCMEFGLHESFPIYAGGLGVLAGDFIKSAHDLKLPVVAITLRWDRGYGVQRIGEDGMPFEEFPGYDSVFLRETGVRVRVRVRGQEIP